MEHNTLHFSTLRDSGCANLRTLNNISYCLTATYAPRACQTIINYFDTLTKKCHIFRQSPLKTTSKWTKPAHSSKESYAFLSRCHHFSQEMYRSWQWPAKSSKQAVHATSKGSLRLLYANLSTETALFMDRSRHFILLSMKRWLLVDGTVKQLGFSVEPKFYETSPVGIKTKPAVLDGPPVE